MWWNDEVTKHIGGIKGQLCMGENKQRYNIYKDELLLLSIVFYGCIICMFDDIRKRKHRCYNFWYYMGFLQPEIPKKQEKVSFKLKDVLLV